ncbi:hypothetical protein [Bellilinea caldifistulae]|uniref:Uncharacterized protein n=1 Tax=Bellilinea caldifistulae TaxID=360411 RepID=A0A0P6X269_9CHLR|nr:hypothetical protein [Bellilinea caldifistulae]KPL73613.1 hypothetical protein AC812_14595 [Bellilinea caldifistulae]
MGDKELPARQKFDRKKRQTFSFTLQPDLPSQNHSLRRAQPGKPCPACGVGIMDYDGLLNLVCPVCGFGEGGCFT